MADAQSIHDMVKNTGYDSMRRTMVEFLQYFVAAMENVLLHQGPSMTAADRDSRSRACREANELLRQHCHPLDDETDDDGSQLPAGVILARSNAGPCSGCGELIRQSDHMLLDTHRGVCFCCRECLDEHGPLRVAVLDDTLPPGVAVYTNNGLVPCRGVDCDNVAGIGDEFLLDPETNKTYCSVACLRRSKTYE